MDHYSKARREGLRVYQAAIQANTDPYLPVLEEKVPNLASLSRLSLGIMPIPLDRVIGSVSRGRSYAFAEGFLPILEGGSEFASKWENLCESVEQKGVNQPVTVLEYLGNYYAIEGNKRISVMKYLDARDIEADVTRVYPPQSDDPEIVSYYEYCDFSKETGLYSIFFSRPGSYRKLLSLPGVRAGDKWTEDEILSLRKLYHYFSENYLTAMKGKPVQPCGDAPEGFDIGVVLPGFDLGQVAAGEGGEAGEDLLGHPALPAQAADHPPGDGVVVALRHKHRSF